MSDKPASDDTPVVLVAFFVGALGPFILMCIGGPIVLFFHAWWETGVPGEAWTRVARWEMFSNFWTERWSFFWLPCGIGTACGGGLGLSVLKASSRRASPSGGSFAGAIVLAIFVGAITGFIAGTLKELYFMGPEWPPADGVSRWWVKFVLDEMKLPAGGMISPRFVAASVFGGICAALCGALSLSMTFTTFERLDDECRNRSLKKKPRGSRG